MKKRLFLLSNLFIVSAAVAVPAADLTWAGTTEDNAWDTEISENWLDADGNAAAFADADDATFDSSSETQNVAISSDVTAGTIAVSEGAYTLVFSESATLTAESLSVAGTASLSVSGAGTLALTSTEKAYFGYCSTKVSADTEVSFSAGASEAFTLSTAGDFYAAYEGSTVSGGSIAASFSASGAAASLAILSAGATYFGYSLGSADSVSATLSASDGASLCVESAGTLYAGYGRSSTGTADTSLSASGSGSSLVLAGAGKVILGYLNAAGTVNTTLAASDGGAASVTAENYLYIGQRDSSGTGTENVSLTATGAGTTLDLTGNGSYVYIGYAAGKGTSNIEISSDDGASTTVTAAKTVYIGNSVGAGTLNLKISSSVGATTTLQSLGESSKIYVGYASSAAKNATQIALSADGENSVLEILGANVVCVGYAYASSETAEISLAATDGGAVSVSSANELYIGGQYKGATGTLAVEISADGAGSSFALSSENSSVYLGFSDSTTSAAGTSAVAISVSNGAAGTVSAAEEIFLAEQSSDDKSAVETSISVEGTGSSLTLVAEKISANSGGTETASAAISVVGGGKFVTDASEISLAGTTLEISGEGSTWSIVSGTAELGEGTTLVLGETGVISLENGGNVSVSAGASVTLSEGSIVQITIDESALALAETGFIVIESADVDFSASGVTLEIIFDGVTAEDLEGFVLVNAAVLGISADLDTQNLIAAVTIDGESVALSSAISLEDGVFSLSFSDEIPEPSAFGIFAGTLAFALAGATRRRSRSRRKILKTERRA